MKRVMYKWMFDYEKEEKWLNEMSIQGWNLVDYAWGRYLFEQGRPGEYIYRIELLEKDHRSLEGTTYIRFMEELGVECVAGHLKWVYFRKKASDGPFDLFTDYDSKITHVNRVLNFARFAFSGNLICALINLSISILDHGSLMTPVNLIVGILNLVVGIVFLPLFFSYREKLKKLREERQLRE